jgi:hypothetical protein
MRGADTLHPKAIFFQLTHLTGGLRRGKTVHPAAPFSARLLPFPSSTPTLEPPPQIRSEPATREVAASTTSSRPRHESSPSFCIAAAGEGRCRCSAAMRPPRSSVSSAPPPRSSSHVTTSSSARSFATSSVLALPRFLIGARAVLILRSVRVGNGRSIHALLMLLVAWISAP